ncbi:MAG: hypothetical protein RL141_64 [Candidatus Parcubacteria bacterium]|jgi:glycosyltransferase involved in cell wall biosynthesis
MNITIDARMMGPQVSRGIGRYVEELVRAMVAEAPEHQYTLVVREEGSSPFRGSPNVQHVVADVPWYGLMEQLKMPGVLARTKPDVVHVPHWNVSIFSRLPRVVTIHDILLLSEPASAKVSTRGPVIAWLKRLFFRIVLWKALFGSRTILVPTQYVADDIRKHFPSLKTPIVVTGEGMPAVNEAVWSEPSDSPYLLYVGSAYPHKGLDGLLDAWKQIAERHPSLSLVLAGEKDVFMERLVHRVATEQLPRVRFLGRVTDQDLPPLYAKATALIFPSRQEGFGLPPLEALAYGCPVIAARASCLPEVLGTEAAIFFQPGSADDILRAVEHVLAHPQDTRQHARRAAYSLAARHTWKHAASRTVAAYLRLR